MTRSAASPPRPRRRTRRSQRSRARCRRAAEPADEAIPFLSRRRWSGLRIGGVRYVLGAPELFPLGDLAGAAAAAPGGRAPGRRLRHHERRASRTTPTTARRRSRTLGLAVLAEELRPDTRETIAYLVEQGVEIVVLSGDAARTVGSIASDAGIPERGPPLDGEALPAGAAELDRVVADRSRWSGGSRRRASVASSSRSGGAGATWRWWETASTTCRR